ncbi:ChrR family anti-sigma-E factor [Glaciecola sp. 1036]|uniref:ChrR family anti-sigma-E factor n=1 Tax=Alteromonadaceae TaxID=72275 RepID=UPI003CFBD1B8
MIRFHPSAQQLSQFAEGNMSPALSLMIASHMDMCKKCMESFDLLQERAVNSFESSHNSFADNVDFSQMFKDITEDKPFCDGYYCPVPQSVVTTTLQLEGKVFNIPQPLQRFAEKARNQGWSKHLGKIWQAGVTIGGKNLAQFIYMEQGCVVPEHSHTGNEITLVIDGQFSDGMSSYDSGDLIFLNDSHTHSPYTANHNGCLVFSIVDSPLHFTDGWAKLINPLSNLYFKANTD